MHESQGRPAEALECYRRAAEADPSYAKAHIAASALNEGLDNLAESLSGYSAAADLEGAEGTISRARARLLKRRGRLRDADDMTRHIKDLKRGHRDDRR